MAFTRGFYIIVVPFGMARARGRDLLTPAGRPAARDTGEGRWRGRRSPRPRAVVPGDHGQFPGWDAGQHDEVDAVEGLQVDARRRTEVVSRRQMAQVAAFLRDYVFGFAGSCITPSGVQVGVRETRRALGGRTATIGTE
jgi:hypothetical protein